MEPKPVINNVINGNFAPDLLAREMLIHSGKAADEFKNMFQQFHHSWLDDLSTKLANSTGKKSFLVSRHKKYIKILTGDIAFFYIRNESVMIVCFDRQEYLINYSLDQIENFLPGKQFYRLNRQYLINFNAVLEAEHYFSRKLLVNSVIPTKDKLVVSKDKVTSFLHWLDSR